MKSFNEMFSLARIFSQAVMHMGTLAALWTSWYNSKLKAKGDSFKININKLWVWGYEQFRITFLYWMSHPKLNQWRKIQYWD